jgi:hypothetical protein
MTGGWGFFTARGVLRAYLSDALIAEAWSLEHLMTEMVFLDCGSFPPLTPEVARYAAYLWALKHARYAREGRCG